MENLTRLQGQIWFRTSPQVVRLLALGIQVSIHSISQLFHDLDVAEIHEVGFRQVDDREEKTLA